MTGSSRSILGLRMMMMVKIVSLNTVDLLMLMMTNDIVGNDDDDDLDEQ